MILEVTDRATGRSRRGNKCLLAIAEVATNPGTYLPTSHQDPNAAPCVNVVTIRNVKASRSFFTSVVGPLSNPGMLEIKTTPASSVVSQIQLEKN